MPRIKLNEHPFEAQEGTKLFQLRDAVNPDADVILLNGTARSSDAPLVTNDEVHRIQRGERPSAEEMERLQASRHTPGVHKKIKTATVGIAGLGGLGSAIAVALARVGIGKLILADFDVVEPSNLNRQQYLMDQIGWLKTQAVAFNLQQINPSVEVETHSVKLTSVNVFPIFEDVDVMIEALDLADQKAMLLHTFVVKKPHIPFIAASGMAGFGTEESLRVKKMGPHIYIVGDLKTGALPHVGLMAPRVGIVAHIQANLALRLLIERE